MPPPRAARADPVAPLDLPDAARQGAAPAAAGVAVVGRARAATALLDPTRRQILGALQEPGSASTIAGALGLSRQRVNYHVRALERAGLVAEVGRRQRRGLEERLVRATATHYLISPEALGALGATPTERADRFSATYQVAVAARTIREVAQLAALARAAGKRLATLTLDAEIRFASPARREAFATELATIVQQLVARYHDAETPDGRTYRLFAGAHPIGTAPPQDEDRTTRRRKR
jgi:DNA-binding transcriptional ArsR family regulator